VLQNLIIVSLVVLALIVLATSWWSGRRHRDPSSSVATFNRALTAMQRTSPADRHVPDDGEDYART
jgi:hypothetical protein